jgi:hypothetical protein
MCGAFPVPVSSSLPASSPLVDLKIHYDVDIVIKLGVLAVYPKGPAEWVSVQRNV